MYKMKKYLLVFSLMVLSFSLFAHENMEPEVSINEQGRIILNSGEELNGLLSFSFVTPNRVYFTKEGQKRKRIKMKEVKEFFVNDLHFVKIKTPSISIGSSDIVAIQKTPVGYKIPLYETISQSSAFSTGADGKKMHKTERTIYIHFSEHKTPRSINDLSLTPFYKKVSKLVEDCEELSVKIANKEQGYRVSIATGHTEKMEIFYRVSEEYQQCK